MFGEILNFCSNNGGAHQMLNLIKSRFCRWHPLAENRWVTLSRAIKRKNFDSIGNRLSKFNWCIWLALHKNIFQACKICFRPLQLKSIISYQMIFAILSLELRLSKLYSKVFFSCQENITLSEWWTQICKKNHSIQTQPLSMGQSQNMIWFAAFTNWP